MNKPLVFLDRNYDKKRSSWVVSDNEGGGYLLTKSMLRKVKQPIVFFAGAQSLPPVKARIDGYTNAMKEYGYQDDQIIVCHANHDLVSDGESIIQQFIEQYQDIPQNFIASSLPILEGVISSLRQHLGYIPTQINIGAFDEHLMLNFLENNIWSIKQNEKEIADKSFVLMQNKIEGAVNIEHEVIPTELICRLKQKPN